MSLLANAVKGKLLKPRRTLLYGVQGCGKSSFAAKWPDAIFIDVERGTSDLDVTRVDCFKDGARAWELLVSLLKEDHSYKTVVIDTIDWMIRMLEEALAKKHGKETLADFDFGKGKAKSGAQTLRLISLLEEVQAKRGMHVLLLAHADQVKIEPPDRSSYFKYNPRMTDVCADFLKEWCDEVLFVGEEFSTKVLDEGFNQTRVIGIGEVRRIMYTTEQPGAYAKNRLDGLPDKIDFTKDCFQKVYSKFLK